ncbi:hypothetical protein JCM21900_002028 [Sporobolomyces salmonicolor]
MNPSIFLLHISAISLASCFIPIIGARYATMRANDAGRAEDGATSSEEDEPVARFIYPIQQPYPTQQQLHRLSSDLRRQISSTPLDAAFTLRQLHLVTQQPQLHLPDAADLSNLLPERWIWRLPATAALHSILRLLLDPRSSRDLRITEALLPIAITIAQNALHFDSRMWATVLRGRGQPNSLEWERLLHRARGQAGAEGLKEDTAVMTRLPEHDRSKETDSELREWEKSYEELARRAWAEAKELASEAETEALDHPGPLSSRLRQRRRAKLAELVHPPLPAGPPPSPLVPSLHPFSSIPARTLDLFIVFLSRHPASASSAISLSLSLSNLRIPRSRRGLNQSFALCLANGRPDLAARLWVDFLEHAERNADGGKQAVRMLTQQLAPVLRPHERAFESVPTRKTLSAVAVLTRALDRQWSRATESFASPPYRGFPPVALSELLRLLATFPPAPFASDFPAGSERFRLARVHARVARMVKHILRRVLEDVIERTIYLGSVNSTLGTPWANRRSPSTRIPLDLLDYNTLISYSLLKLQSAELALLVLERMTDQGHSPSAATHNILFKVLADGRQSFGQMLERNLTNDHTLPVLLTHMTRTASFDELESIVFRIVPELDMTPRLTAPTVYPPSHSTSSKPLPLAVTIPPPPRRSSAFTPSPPPSTGRSPYLYTTLLHALACAGRIGLAERVFRNARWAAELSRSEPAPRAQPGSSEEKPRRRRGWVLPPHAFTIMLQMYAAELRRGRQLERQAVRSTAPESGAHAQTLPPPPPASRAFVRGWGRHALRVFLLHERKSRLASQLGASAVDASSSARSRHLPSRTLDLPAFLRSEAAPIVAVWELEGGSKGPELASLEAAMKSAQAREALRVLFPESEAAREGGMLSRWSGRRRKVKKDVVEERRAVRSEQMRRIERKRREAEMEMRGGE